MSNQQDQELADLKNKIPLEKVSEIPYDQEQFFIFYLREGPSVATLDGQKVIGINIKIEVQRLKIKVQQKLINKMACEYWNLLDDRQKKFEEFASKISNDRIQLSVKVEKDTSDRIGRMDFQQEIHTQSEGCMYNGITF